jgi:hypothetical protein
MMVQYRDYRRQANTEGTELLQPLPGHQPAAEENFNETSSEGSFGQNVNEMEIALMYLRLGEQDRALDWLERGYETHHPGLPSISNRTPSTPSAPTRVSRPCSGG